MSHLCPAWRCSWMVGDSSKLMCPKHWRMVPRLLQRAVYGAWRHGEGLGSDELYAAQLAAIEAVNATLQGTRS